MDFKTIVKDLFSKPTAPVSLPAVSVKHVTGDDIEQKAFIQETSVNAWQFFYGQSSTKYYSPKQLLAYNTGWVNVCNTKNSLTLSTIPVNLYYRNATGKDIKAYRTRPVSTKTLRRMEASTGKSMGGGDVVQLESHRVLDLLHCPNPRMCWPDFVGMVQQYLGLIGNAYVKIERDDKGLPIALWPLLSECVSAVVKENDIGYGDVKEYHYSRALSQHGQAREEVTIIKPEDVMHFANYSPGNTLYGKGELEAALACAEREFYYDQAENYLNKNNARPDFLVSYKNGMTEAQQKEITRLWYKKYGTPLNAGKPIITNGEVDIKQLNFSPRDMQYIMGRTEVRREVCAVFGVPNSLVDIENSNLASSKSAMDHYRQYTILPKLQKFLEKINQQLVEKFDEDLFAWYDGDMITSEDPLERAGIDKIYLDEGIYGPSYVRARMGIESEQPDAEKATPTSMRETDTASEPGKVESDVAASKKE